MLVYVTDFDYKRTSQYEFISFSGRAGITNYSYYKATFPIDINGKLINPSQNPKTTQNAFSKVFFETETCS